MMPRILTASIILALLLCLTIFTTAQVPVTPFGTPVTATISGTVAPASASLAGADGVSNTVNTPSTSGGAQLYYRTFPYLFNGSTNDRDFSCANTLRVNVAATGPTEIIPLTMGQIIRICNINGTPDAATPLDVSIVYGTGTNCGTGTTTIAGPYDQITAMSLFTKSEPLTIPVGNAVCLTNSAATAFTGSVIYAKF